jgi:hypothetical protein
VGDRPIAKLRPSVNSLRTNATCEIPTKILQRCERRLSGSKLHNAVTHPGSSDKTDRAADEIVCIVGNLPRMKRSLQTPIGVGYSRIFNQYLSRAFLSASEAPRSTTVCCVALLFEKKGTIMLGSKISRRGFATTAATGIASIGLLGATAQSADAYQGNMERAISSLYEALGSLREATANKGGHRARAMELVRQAIDETQAGIEFADERAG